MIVATDLRARRIELLARTVAASGACSIRVLRADAEQRLPFFPVFDAVLVDAPCSGLGIIRRDPDLKWRRTEADFVALASAQRRLLDQAAGVLRTGGRLIYATCSSEPEENDEVVDAFLEARPDFRPGQPPELSEAVRALVDASGRMRTLPHKDRLESFFAATLVKRSDSQ
jgi:16S rRNA (cytosine967-C5)-methyltransferase